METDSNGRHEAPGVARTRRGFLRDITAGSVAAAVALTAIAPAAEATQVVPHPHPGTVKVFRLRSRKTVSCRACRIHHRYMIFRSRKVARLNRAHPGCDCPLEPQWIARKTFRHLFKPVGRPQRDVVDLRHVAIETRG
jgi:hypothetical protein